MPTAILFGKSAPWDEIMDVRMVGQLSAPRVQHAEEPRQITADVLFIGCQFLDGLRRSLEQGRIARALMASDQSAEFLRNGKGDHKVVPRKLSLHLLDEPLMGFVVLTVGTMPVAA